MSQGGEVLSSVFSLDVGIKVCLVRNGLRIGRSFEHVVRTQAHLAQEKVHERGWASDGTLKSRKAAVARLKSLEP